MTDFEDVLDQAYSLYMPQIRSEISELYDFVRRHRGLTPKSEPYNILEIGTKFGGTFFLWNTLNNGPGNNISIDMTDGGRHGGISEEEMDKRDDWFNKRFENCHFIRGNSHDESTLDYLAAGLMSANDVRNGVNLYSHQYFDFLFIDGDHTYEGVKKDWGMYSPFIKKGGIIAFHDIVISDYHHSRDVHVGEFWNDLTKVRKHNFQNPNEDICIIDGNEYRVYEFVEDGNNWGGIGTLVKI